MAWDINKIVSHKVIEMKNKHHTEKSECDFKLYLDILFRTSPNCLGG